MTSQYFNQDINRAPDPAFVLATALNAAQQGTADTAVLRYDPTTESGLDHFRVTTNAANGTVVTILQPGTYVATMSLAIAAAACAIGISLNGTAPPFTTTPVAIGTVDGLIAMAGNTVADASVQSCSATFHITPANIVAGTANDVRFQATVGGAFVVTQVAMRIDRVTAA